MSHPIHSETYGFEDSSREVVVFLNGMTQSTAHWKSQARAFSERFRVVTYDARGQGGTALGEEDLSLQLHASDLKRLLDELEVETAHLVGFSHGARIALKFANDYADRVQRLVLISATATPTALARTIVRAWAEVLELGGIEAMSWCALPNILGNEYLEANEKIIPGIVKASIQRNDPAGVAALLEGMRDYPDLSELAGGVSAETLVVSASEDLLVKREGAEKLAQLCGGSHVEVEGIGHTIPIEAPEEFRDHVVDFLSQ